MIEAHGLTRRFGSFPAVSDLSLAVAAGSILALLGPNGAGKTTTVRMLAALLAPSEGEARVAGYDVRREPDAVRASVGLMTDAPGLYEQMTVTDYLNLYGTIYGIPGPERRRRIHELLAFFELEEFQAQRMMGFSKGMKQKVALARALIHEPPVLFLDEPTAGLDPLAVRAVRELILGLKHGRRTIVLCTHDLDEAERLADEVAILRRGRIVARDTPAALRSRAASGTLVRIELAGPCAGAPESLREVPGVEAPRLLSSNGAGPGAPAVPGSPGVPVSEGGASRDTPVLPASATLVYGTREPRVVNPQVVARLVAAGAQVVSITCEAPSLEDVYANAMGEASHER